MFNKLIATVILVFAIPAMASAWTLTTRATSAGGTISSVTKSGQRSTDGPLS